MTGGHPSPEDIDWCVVCSDPRDGRVTGRVWRWPWFQRLLVVNRNMRFFHRVMAMTRGTLGGRP